MKHEEAISEVLRLLDDNKKRQFPFLTEKEESAVRALLAQVKELTAEHARVTQIRDNYAAAARVIALYLDDYCDISLPYDQMIAAASRNVEAYVSRLTAERDAAVRRAEAERARKQTKLTPIYTCGGHSLSKDWDDDDEDFWCPICHTHIGTHCGYAAECPKCGQAINTDSEPCYNYRDMKNSKREWRGPEPGGEGKP